MYSIAQLRDEDRPVTMGPDRAKASRSPVVGLNIEMCVCAHLHNKHTHTHTHSRTHIHSHSHSHTHTHFSMVRPTTGDLDALAQSGPMVTGLSSSLVQLRYTIQTHIRPDMNLGQAVDVEKKHASGEKPLVSQLYGDVCM